MLQAQLAAFLLGDSNASSTAMRSAAQLVQLLDPPPATQALTNCLPALLPNGPCSGHVSMPLPVSQVWTLRNTSQTLEGSSGWANIRTHMDVGGQVNWGSPGLCRIEHPALVTVALYQHRWHQQHVNSGWCWPVTAVELPAGTGMYLPDREVRETPLAGTHPGQPCWSCPLQHGHACQHLELALDSPPTAGLHLGSPPHWEAQRGVAAVQQGPA